MTEKYHISSRIIHWIMALIILGLLALGFYIEFFLDSSNPNRGQFYALHKSFGVIALIFIFIRVFNRLLHNAPKLPETIKKSEQNLAKIIQFSLYIMMFIMPISGYLMSNSFGYDVYLFSLKMPTLIEKNYELGKIFSKTHGYCAYLLVLALILHISGAMKHRFFDKNKNNDVLKRII